MSHMSQQTLSYEQNQFEFKNTATKMQRYCLSFSEFSINYKHIRDANDPYFGDHQLLQYLPTKSQVIAKKIGFDSYRQLQELTDFLQIYIQFYQCNKQNIAKFYGYCVKTKHDKDSGERKHGQVNEELHHQKEMTGEVLLIYSNEDSLQQVVKHKEHLAVRFQTQNSPFSETHKERSYFSEETLENILFKTFSFLKIFGQEKEELAGAVLRPPQSFIETELSLVPNFIQLSHCESIDETSKVLFCPFIHNDLNLLRKVGEHALEIEQAFLDETGLSVLDSFQKNRNPRFRETQRNPQRSFMSKEEQSTTPLVGVQSLGLILFKMMLLSLGSSRQKTTNLYSLNLSKQFSINYSSIGKILVQMQEKECYSKLLIFKIEMLIFQSKNYQSFEDLETYIFEKKLDQSFSSVRKSRFSKSRFSANSAFHKQIFSSSSTFMHRDQILDQQQLVRKNLKSKQHTPQKSQYSRNNHSNVTLSGFSPNNSDYSPILSNFNSNIALGINQLLNSKIHSKSLFNKYPKVTEKILCTTQGHLVSDLIQKQFRDGSYYIGQYNPSKNIKEGKGVYFYFQGDVYGGTWENDQLNGQGLYLFANGDKYEGQVCDGQKEGYGVYEYINGNSYRGFWHSDKKEGKGEYMFSNGDNYFGEFSTGNRHGKGILRMNSKRIVYEGGFLDNLKHGSGSLKITNKSQIIEGHWDKDNLIQKRVKIKFFDPIENGKSFTQIKSEYEGELLNGIVEGKGKMKFIDGLEYQGQFKGNMLNGAHCQITYPNGDQYYGEVFNNLPQGSGSYRFQSKGFVQRGRWVRGVIEGKGQIQFIETGIRVKDVEWINGKLNYSAKMRVFYTHKSEYFEGQLNRFGQRNGEGKYFVPNPQPPSNNSSYTGKFDRSQKIAGSLISGQFFNNQLIKVYSSVPHYFEKEQ